MNCTVCYRSLPKGTKPIKLNCSCASCIDCLSFWMIEQINALEFQTKEEILCMEGYCKQPFKIENVIDQFPQSYQEKINEALLNVYFRKTQDIRQCPKDSCNYAGILNTTSDCDGNIHCGKCNTQWKEKTVSGSLDWDSKKILPDASEISCVAWEELFTKKCPKCSTSIEKNGGCSHMTCKGCGKEFCWYCTQDNFTHDNKICWINLSAKLVFVICFVVHLVCLSGICGEIMEMSLKVFNGVLEAFFLDFFLYLLCIISPHNIIGRFYTAENKIRLLTSLAIFSFFVLVVFLLDAFYSILRIFLFQAVVVGVGLIYVDCLGKWVTYVY